MQSTPPRVETSTTRLVVLRSCAVLVPIVVLYALANLTFVFFVPVLHRLRLEVVVIGEANQQPIAGAEVFASWRAAMEPESIGTTDARGVLRVVHTFQQQPRWFWPQIGRCDLSRSVLFARAPGHLEREVSLSDQLAELPLSDPRAALRVELRPE